ncbi:hypothetical protein QVD17_35777 [Tagetes erecta]|uniref:Uncharacterized protein n=1 Tax=Tagetes erecta TaxID=13708 RepID=A0AAD8JTA4_TARER|nr:hypothetical protein QVD17_35777 [Tagetes erecta]
MKDSHKLANSESISEDEIKETIKNILDGLPKEDEITLQKIVELSMQFSKYCSKLEAVFKVTAASLTDSFNRITCLEAELLAHSQSQRTLTAILAESENTTAVEVFRCFKIVSVWESPPQRHRALKRLRIYKGNRRTKRDCSGDRKINICNEVVKHNNGVLMAKKVVRYEETDYWVQNAIRLSAFTCGRKKDVILT